MASGTGQTFTRTDGRRRIRLSVHAVVRDHETARGAEVRVDLDALASAIRKIIAKDSTVKLADDYRQRIAEANRENDCGHLDSIDCDAIFQVAALGEVIYG